MRKYTALFVFIYFAVTLQAQNFINGQAARAVFGQYTFTYGGATPGFTTNLPNNQILGGVSGLAWANGLLYVADSNRLAAVPQDNRVVMFNTAFVPSPTADLTNLTSTYNCNLCAFPAKNALGQPSWTASTTGIAGAPNAFPIGLDNDPGQPNMRTPTAVASDGNLVAVADTDNNRVLIWTSIPTSLNQAANLVLGQADFTHSTVTTPPTASSLLGPQGVWIQGGKFYVADTQNNRVLIWNSIPTSNNQAADVVLGASNFNTSTQSACDPTKTIDVATASSLCSPTSVTTDASHIFISDLGSNRVLIWNSLAPSNNAPANVVVGQPDMVSTEYNNQVLCNVTPASGALLPPCGNSLNFPRYALSDGTRLFVADGGNDRVLVFNTIPTQNATSADEVLGEPNFTSDNVSSAAITIASTALDNSSAVDITPSPTSLAFDGNNLYVSDPVDNRVLVFTPGNTPLPNNSILNWASEIIRQEGIVQVIANSIVVSDTVAVTIGTNTYTYTVKSKDTADLIAQGLVSLINAGSGDPNAIATFVGTGTGALYLSSIGTDLGYDTIAFSTLASNTTDLTVTASGNGYLTAGTAATGSPQMLVEINGSNLSDVPAGNPIVAPLTGVIPKSLGGAQVFMDGVATPIYSVSNTQIVSQIPYNLADRNSTSVYVRTTHSDGSITVTNASPIYIAQANPGIFNAPSTPGQPRPWPATGIFHQPGNPEAVVDLTGTVTAGDVLTIKVLNTSYSYTVLSSDTLTTITANLANVINNANDPNVTAVVGGNFNRVIVVARQPGIAGNGIAVSASASASASITLTSYNDATCCDVVAGSPITAANPAAPGETITLSAAGLGQVVDLIGNVVPNVAAGVPFEGEIPNSAYASVSATLGGATAQVVNAQLAQGSYGIYQVQILVPQGQATNATTSLYIAQNAFLSNTVTVPVGPANPNPPASSLTTSTPLIAMYLDQPKVSSPASGSVPVSGWIIGYSATISTVQIAVDGQTQPVSGTTYGVSRPDVCQVYTGAPSCANGNVNVGFSASLDTTQLVNGPHTVQVVATDANGDRFSNSFPITTSNSGSSTAQLYIDTLGSGIGSFQGLTAVRGWALDASSAVTGVTISVDGIAAGSATYGISRPDVCAVYAGVPGCPNVGWTYLLDTTRLTNGTHLFAARMAAGNGDYLTQTGQFTVANWTAANPTLAYIDRPNASSGPLSGVQTLYGWALNANSQIASVSIAVDGALLGNATIQSPRFDVCAAYPNGIGCPNVGWTFPLDTTLLADGVHTLAVAVTPQSGQGFTLTSQFQVANLAIAANPTRMYIDSPALNGAPVSGYASFNGWAINDSSAITSVSLSIDGNPVGPAIYGGSRPDVCVAYPGRSGCPNVGWNFAYDTTLLIDGTHILDVTSMAANGDRGTVSAQFSVSNAGRTSPTTVTISYPNAGNSAYLGLAQFSGTATSTSSTISRITISIDGYPYGSATYLPAGANAQIPWTYTLNTSQVADGAHTLGVIAVAADGTYSVSSVAFQVANWSTAEPTLIYIDTPNANNPILTGSVTLRGWAFNSNSDIANVTVTIDGVASVGGVALGSAIYGASRPDVCAAYGNQQGCPNVGWTLPVDTTYLTNGSHTMAVTATTVSGQSYTVSTSFTAVND